VVGLKHSGENATELHRMQHNSGVKTGKVNMIKTKE